MSTLHEKAIDYLSHREHSRLELKQKLLKKNFFETDIDRELDILQSKNLQSDERFAHRYVHSRRLAGFGPQRIVLELQERGISEKLIIETVDAHSPAWQKQMIEVLKKKFPHSPQDQSSIAAQFRFLSYRGYALETINKLLFSIQQLESDR